MAGQIFEQGPLDVPATYTVPGLVAISPLAITATLDGTGASGDFLACLSIYSPSGDLIARVPTSQAVTAGDTALVTWAPFLRSAGGGATPTALNLPWGLARYDGLSVASGAGFTVVSFDLTDPNVSFGSSGDGVVTITVDGGGFHNLTVNTQGLYYVSWHVFAQKSGVPAANTTIDIASDFDSGDYVAGSLLGPPLLVSAGPARNYEAGEALMLNADPALTPIPITGRIKMRQNSGLTLSCFIGVSAVRLSNISSPNVF